MAKTSRASKAPSSKTRSNTVDGPVSMKSSVTPRRASKVAHPIPSGEPSTPVTPYQLHAIPAVNPQQYPQMQFVHLPYSYPYVLQAAVPHQTRPPVPSQLPHLRSSPPTQPQPSSSSTTPAPPPTLESVFRETMQKLHDLETTLSNTQVVTKRALVRHQYELQKWKTHCMAFKQERDAARETIKSLMEERARLLNREPNVPLEMTPEAVNVPSASTHPVATLAKEEPVEVQLPSPPLAFIQTDVASENRKASRASRKHSPYSSPTAGPSRRPSSSSDIPTYNCARWDPSVYPILPGARAFSSPPSLSGPQPSPTTPSSPADPFAHPVAPGVDERLQGLEFVRFDHIRQEGDDTAFDVTWAPSSEPMELEYPLPRSPSAVRVKPGEDSDSDMELESDEEGDALSPEPSGSMPRPAVPKPPGPTTKPTVDIDHIDLLFTPAGGRIWCRLCMLEHSNRTAARFHPKDIADRIDPRLTNFKPNEGWPELRDHWTEAHPAESERLAGLNYEELWRLRDSRAQPSAIQS